MESLPAAWPQHTISNDHSNSRVNTVLPTSFLQGSKRCYYYKYYSAMRTFLIYNLVGQMLSLSHLTCYQWVYKYYYSNIDPFGFLFPIGSTHSTDMVSCSVVKWTILWLYQKIVVSGFLSSTCCYSYN